MLNMICHSTVANFWLGHLELDVSLKTCAYSKGQKNVGHCGRTLQSNGYLGDKFLIGFGLNPPSSHYPSNFAPLPPKKRLISTNFAQNLTLLGVGGGKVWW